MGKTCPARENVDNRAGMTARGPHCSFTLAYSLFGTELVTGGRLITSRWQ